MRYSSRSSVTPCTCPRCAIASRIWTTSYPTYFGSWRRAADLTLAPNAFRQLTKYSWPGNVEQLRRVLNEVVQRQRSGVADVDQLPPECRATSRRRLTEIEALERDAIVRSLAENGGRKGDAATALGVSRATAYRKIREFGIVT